ncbi:hypothetical protein [Nigerium massiliense]|uniref:hypothetical protein n=1 Tax=Nigerium massiliense TaxID=1522317 RepID=UPI00058EB345|nr:hypothetical protein [Nigerium massiliense]
MTPLTDADLDDFLVRYETSLTSFDAQASASLWGMPGTLVNDEFVGTIDSRDLMVQGLTQSYPLYRQLELHRVTHTLLERADLTERLVRVRVRWHFHSIDEHLADSDYEYVLRRDDDGALRAYVSVDIDATQQLIALARRKGVRLDQPAS